jgi:branched-chain amino acid transport system ATP-binding protein
MRDAGKTILLVEQNVRVGLAVATHGVVMEGGKVRLQGLAREVLEHPEIADLYLGGHVARTDGNGRTPAKTESQLPRA